MRLKKLNLVVIGVLLILTILKLYNINGGFVPAEPDERNYLNVVQNFHHGALPNFDGEVLFHSPPLFQYIGFVFSFFLKGYLPIRVVSLLASFILGIGIYFYLRYRTNISVAIFTSSLFTILPIIVYYSRLGLIELLISLWAFSFIVCFDLAWKKSSLKWAALSGAALGLGMITKYSILPLVGVPVVVFGGEVLKNVVSERNLNFLFSKKYLRTYLLLIILGAVAFLIFFPITYYNYSLNPSEFKSQLKQDFALGGRPFELQVVKDYLTSIIGHFTLPIVLLLLIGFLSAIKNWQKNLPILLSVVFLTYALLKISLYTPRYFVIMVPFLTILVGFGLNFVWGYLQKVSSKIKVGALLLLFLSVLPASFYAVRASYHTTVEEVGNFIQGQNSKNEWVASNYWPSAFIDQVGYKISWYSADLGDSKTFSAEGKTKYQPLDLPTYDLIAKEGGWVVVEDLFSKTLSSKAPRKDILPALKTHEPVKVFEDKSPNWPYYQNSSNSFAVYHITPP